jgi:excisionase family DNA binding protein
MTTHDMFGVPSIALPRRTEVSSSPASPSPDGPNLWTVADVARFLGVSRSWVYKAARNRSIPSIKVGAAVRFRPDLVKAWADGVPVGAAKVTLPTCHGTKPSRG